MADENKEEIADKKIDLKIDGDDVNKILSIIYQNRPDDLFALDVARYVVGKRRYDQAVKSSELVTTGNERCLWDDAISLAKVGLSNFGAIARSSRLVRPMSAIDKVYLNADKLRALSIGPRTEMELLSLVGQGFRPQNIRGLDLISYSPWIDVGNAHDMPYEDNSFDVVVAGWVLVYSSDPQKICEEIVRVSRNGAVIAIGSTYWPQEKRQKEAPERTEQHYPLVENILGMFSGFVDKIYVRHDPPDLSVEGRTIVIFDIHKS